jgi:hypothetical protein
MPLMSRSKMVEASEWLLAASVRDGGLSAETAQMNFLPGGSCVGSWISISIAGDGNEGP